jgi:hypothetical protein
MQRADPERQERAAEHIELLFTRATGFGIGGIGTLRARGAQADRSGGTDTTCHVSKGMKMAGCNANAGYPPLVGPLRCMERDPRTDFVRGETDAPWPAFTPASGQSMHEE